MKPLHLSDITLVCIGGSYSALSTEAVKDTLSRFSFDNVLLFSNDPMNCLRLNQAGGWHQTNINSNKASGLVGNITAFPYIKTNYALYIQWDGYPINPDLWSEDFRAYDFIGAIWPWLTENTIGNGGFCLRSRKLMEALATDAELAEYDADDTMIGRIRRSYLEVRHGIHFPPEEVAMKFSTEYYPNTTPTFGFHGPWHFLDFMSDEEVKARLNLMPPALWKSYPITRLAGLALQQDRRDLFFWVEKRKVELGNG